jgi:hypothetical protein
VQFEEANLLSFILRPPAENEEFTASVSEAVLVKNVCRPALRFNQHIVI